MTTMPTQTTTARTVIGDGPVLLEVHEDGLAHLRLNRPDDSNALSTALICAFRDALLECHADESVRALLLTGSGRNFCAGGDVKEFRAQGDDLPGYLRKATAILGEIVTALIHLPRPVVTVVQGWAAGGGGLALVCASDLVIASESARFMAGATRVGMVPDGGATVALSQIVGHRRAMEIVLTNRVLSAAEALEIGLITRVAPGDEEALAQGMALARELANGPTESLGATKRLLWSGLGSSVEAGLPRESAGVSEMARTADTREALAAVVERREPRFRR